MADSQPSAAPKSLPIQSFTRTVAERYDHRRKRGYIVTGNVGDIYHNGDDYGTLPQVIWGTFQANFTVVRFSLSGGITFFTPEDETAVVKVCTNAAVVQSAREGDRKDLREIAGMMMATQFESLPALVLLKLILDTFNRVRRDGVLSKEETPKPLCVIFEYASGLFPSGKLGNLGELDRQRVLALTGWLDDPRFQMGANILMLISETNAELSDLIVGHRAMESISVRRPDEAARRRFVEKRGAEVQFDGTLDQFIKDCEGLHLVGIQDLLLEALYTGKPVSRKAVLVRINQMLKDELGEDVAEQFLPSYGPEAIIGNEEAVKRLQQMLIRADRRPEKAARVLLVTGPNGGGKTFVTQGCLPDDRVVLLLKAMRDSEYGETEKRVEKLRYFFEMFPRLLVLVDEADTWFGQVSGRNTHEVDRRMTGSFLQMMTDKTLFVLFWLATARPKGLPPDLISRAAIQIPILDLAGEERKKFVKEMFHRDGIGLEAATLDSLMEHSTHWSARDYRHFLEEFGDAREDDNTLTVDTMVTQWQAPYAIVGDRELQTLHAIQYCSYPSLIPIEYRGSAGQEKLQAQIAVLEARLNR